MTKAKIPPHPFGDRHARKRQHRGDARRELPAMDIQQLFSGLFRYACRCYLEWQVELRNPLVDERHRAQLRNRFMEAFGHFAGKAIVNPDAALVWYDVPERYMLFLTGKSKPSNVIVASPADLERLKRDGEPS